MKRINNKFGAGILYESKDLGNCIYAVCTACMSVWSDFLSYADSEKEKRGKEVTGFYSDDELYQTDTIVVLGCQVTDLAIYNDLDVAEKLHKKYPDIPIYMGGCLAHRFDIELPEWLRRLDVIRTEYQEIFGRDGEFIYYRRPFWNRDLKEDCTDEFETGNLFRHMYPLKIGAGCHGMCKYCTIRDTRGESYESDAFLQVKEFLNHADEGVVLISDSPTIRQIQDWCMISLRYGKPISFRNVEPQNALYCKKQLLNLSKAGLLKIFHCPIQSNDPEVLQAMNRDVQKTLDYIEFAQELRREGTKVATNIIIDYKVGSKVFHNMPQKWLNDHFDYWSWNPYFDGKWNYEKAKQRFKYYIGE